MGVLSFIQSLPLEPPKDYKIVGGPYRKWASLFFGLCWMIVCGAAYAYSSLSADLQGLGYRDISTIGSCGNVGSYVLSILAGLTLDNFGSNYLAHQSWTLVTVGWLGFRFALVNNPGDDGLAAICFLVIGIGSISGFLATVNSVEEQFPTRYRGTIHGIFLAAYVLSSAIWASIYYGIFQGHIVDYATTMIIVSAVLGTLNAASQINHRAVRALKKAQSFVQLQTVKVDGPAASAILAAQPTTDVAAVTGVASTGSEASQGSVTPATPGGGSPVSVDPQTGKPIHGSTDEHGRFFFHVHRHRHGHDGGLLHLQATWGNETFETAYEQSKAAGVKDSFLRVLTLRSRLSSYVYLLYCILFCIHGAARIFVNSAGLAIKSMRGPNDPDKSATNAFVRNIVVIFSVTNMIGRTAGGYIHDRLAQKGIARVFLLIPSSILVLTASFLLAFAPINEGTIIAGAVLIGLGDGLGFVTWPVAVKEEFTPARYGKSFSLFNSAVGFGSLGLNAMATYIYHHSGTQLANGSWVCYGQQCFENTWIVAGSLVAGFGVVLSLVLLTLVYTKGILTAAPGHTYTHTPSPTATLEAAAGSGVAILDKSTATASPGFTKGGISSPDTGSNDGDVTNPGNHVAGTGSGSSTGSGGSTAGTPEPHVPAAATAAEVPPGSIAV